MRSDLVERGFAVLGDPVPPINLEDESVDLVHSSAVIEHLENYSTVLDYFSEARRVLKRGGIISSIVPNCNTIGMIFYLYDYQHNFVTNPGRLKRLLEDAGFEVTHSRSFLTTIGFSSFALLDRIIAHAVLAFMRSPLIYGLVHLFARDEIARKVYKNLFDQIFVVGTKS